MKNHIHAIFLILFAFTLSGINNTYAAASAKPGYSILLPGKWKDVKVSELVELSSKDVTRLTGKKMNITEKVSFVLLKKKMKRALKKNSTLTAEEFYYSLTTAEIVWLIVIIVLALLLLLVMIALLGGL